MSGVVIVAVAVAALALWWLCLYAKYRREYRASHWRHCGFPSLNSHLLAHHIAEATWPEAREYRDRRAGHVRQG